MSETAGTGVAVDPPFATATLARLYAQQGHVEQAERLLRRVRAAGPAPDGRADAPGRDPAGATRTAQDAFRGRERVLRELLERVRAARRAPRGS